MSNDTATACLLAGPLLGAQLIHADGAALKTTFLRRGRIPPMLLLPHAQNTDDLVLYGFNWCGPAPGPLRIQAREAGEPGRRAQASWIYSEWLRKECTRLGPPAVEARPWDTGLARVLAAVDSRWPVAPGAALS